MDLLAGFEGGTLVFENIEYAPNKFDPNAHVRRGTDGKFYLSTAGLQDGVALVVVKQHNVEWVAEVVSLRAPLGDVWDVVDFMDDDKHYTMVELPVDPNNLEYGDWLCLVGKRDSEAEILERFRHGGC